MPQRHEAQPAYSLFADRDRAKHITSDRKPGRPDNELFVLVEESKTWPK
jgi:hypothetical protein